MALAAVTSANFTVSVPSYVRAAACNEASEAVAKAQHGTNGASCNNPTLAAGDEVYVATYWDAAAAKKVRITGDSGGTGETAWQLLCSLNDSALVSEPTEAGCNEKSKPTAKSLLVLRYQLPTDGKQYRIPNNHSVNLTITDAWS